MIVGSVLSYHFNVTLQPNTDLLVSLYSYSTLVLAICCQVLKSWKLLQMKQFKINSADSGLGMYFFEVAEGSWLKIGVLFILIIDITNHLSSRYNHIYLLIKRSHHSQQYNNLAFTLTFRDSIMLIHTLPSFSATLIIMK